MTSLSLQPSALLLYGSLRLGQPAFHELGLDEALLPAGAGIFPGMLIDLGDYPGVRLNDSGSVHAEVYTGLTHDILQTLDNYERFNPNDIRLFQRSEGLGSLYIRRLTNYYDANGAWRGTAHVYEFNGEIIGGSPRQGDIVAHGDWLRHLAEKPRQTKLIL